MASCKISILLYCDILYHTLSTFGRLVVFGFGPLVSFLLGLLLNFPDVLSSSRQSFCTFSCLELAVLPGPGSAPASLRTCLHYVFVVCRCFFCSWASGPAGHPSIACLVSLVFSILNTSPILERLLHSIFVCNVVTFNFCLTSNMLTGFSCVSFRGGFVLLLQM